MAGFDATAIMSLMLHTFTIKVHDKALSSHEP